jgi:AraC family transcriptional regulator of adaptative response/methylated-DNA-[protein]-cysteine methyltransferase
MGTDPMTDDYHRMAEAIRFIDATQADHPRLEDVAAHLGLSPGHFQRLFTRWAGVSPKKFQQYLTLGHAKSLLRERHSVLDTTLETGLSGPGRLHDLFVGWEAMTPGDYARDGAGLDIAYGYGDTPFGEGLVHWTERGICGLAFTAETGREAALADMNARWPAARHQEDAARATILLHQIFGGGANGVHLAVTGAPFQTKVWEALMQIPSGHVTTYSDIAIRIGNPKAVRAVGTAVGRNPVSWLIPCHRALRKSGALGGYHWGLPVKRAMMAWESARLDADTDIDIVHQI